jgi:hypothetical protein
MEAINVLIAVKSKALARVIQHALHGQAGIAGIDFAHSEQRLIGQAQTSVPGSHYRQLSTVSPGAGSALTELKRANPQSKLILTCDFEEFSRSIDSGIADARVLDETLVQQLPAIARRLMSGANVRKGDSAQPRRIPPCPRCRWWT